VTDENGCCGAAAGKTLPKDSVFSRFGG